MTQITIDENWSIVVDNHGNHIPHRWREVKKKQDGKATRDSVGTGVYDWHSENKFFPNTRQCIKYIIDQNMLDNVETTSLEEYMEMYVKMFELYKDLMC